MKKTLALLTLLFLSSCSNDKTLYLKTENAEGLTLESYLSLNGFKIGTIDEIKINNEGALLIKSTLKNEINIPADSEFKIEESGLIGPKIIILKLGKSKKMISEKDTMRLQVKTKDSLIVDVKKLVKEYTDSDKNDSILKELKRLNQNLEKQQHNK